MKRIEYPKINVVIGTRAQLIKTAPVMKLLQDKNIPYRFIYTAQHKETFKEISENFGLKEPDYVVKKWDTEAKTMKSIVGNWFLDIMWKLVTKRKEILPTKGGIVLVHGDTVSAAWGALLGRLTGNKVMHLESGLRSYNIFKPFPEEIIRIITFILSNVYAAPNKWAINNLKRFRGIKINTKMNTQYDSITLAIKNLEKVSFDVPKEKYVVASIHRYEHVFRKEKFKEILRILEQITEKMKVVFVLHPVTAKQLEKYHLNDRLSSNPNVILQERLPFFEFIKLIYHSEFVVTDGGSNQEELSYMGKPTLILRDVTERIEGLGENAVLAKFDKEVIRDFIKNYDNYKRSFKKVSVTPSQMIVEWLEKNILKESP